MDSCIFLSFNWIMSVAMAHGIVVLTLTQAVKYLCLLSGFQKPLLLIKVCTVVIFLIAGWFGSWLIAVK